MIPAGHDKLITGGCGVDSETSLMLAGQMPNEIARMQRREREAMR